MNSLHVARLSAGCATLIFFVFLIAQPANRPTALLRDFNAFYCAGQAISRHADPYRNEPLGTCERSGNRPSFLERGPEHLTAPAPLPGYAIAPFVLLAQLPYTAAAFVWTLVILASFALTVGLLRDLTTLSLGAIIAALALSDGYIGLTLGQIAPVALAAVVVAAWARTRGNTFLAACGGALALIEPNIGVPVCAALAVFSPRTLLWLIPLGVLFGLLSIALLGWQTNVEYITHVIEAHGLSEASNVKQLSLTTVLTHGGVRAQIALRAGEVWYMAMIVIGLLASRFVMKHTDQPAQAVLVPVAFAMTGGAFVHIAQVAAAIPAALLLLDAHRDDRVLVAAVLALAVPWLQFATLGSTFPFLAAIVTGILAFELLPGGFFWKLAPMLLAAFIAAAPTSLLKPVAFPGAELSAIYHGDALAQTSWSVYVQAVGTKSLMAYDLARLPTWLGLFTLCFSTLRGRMASSRH